MSQPVRRPRKRWRIGQWAGAGVAAALATLGVVALRHALETPQPLKSQLPGEALLYRWQRRSIFYKVLGSPDGPPLVLLHSPEIGASADEMQHILSPLAQTYRVYALDLLGFGLSDRPALEYSAATYHMLCRDFLRDVVKKPATLLASGLSCNYAIAVAADTPELCNALVLIAPLALQNSQQSAPFGEFSQVPLVKTLLYPLLSTRAAFLLMRNQQRDKQADFAQFYAQTHQFGAEHAAMALLAGKLAEGAARQFQTLRQPVLMVWGTRALEDQRLLASMQTAAALADPTRQTREVEIIPQAGLMAHRDQPESVVAAIKRWQSEKAISLPEPAETLTTASFQEQDDTAECAPLVAPQAQQPADTSVEITSIPVSTSSAEAASISAPTPFTEQGSNPPFVDNETEAQTVIAYCVKCKQKREILNAQEVTMKNGRLAMRGTCATCGSGIYRIGGLG
jgi:pimeloyl-ACP methyl ester carboxylesterase